MKKIYRYFFSVFLLICNLFFASCLYGSLSANEWIKNYQDSNSVFFASINNGEELPEEFWINILTNLSGELADKSGLYYSGSQKYCLSDRPHHYPPDRTMTMYPNKKVIEFIMNQAVRLKDSYSDKVFIFFPMAGAGFLSGLCRYYTDINLFEENYLKYGILFSHKILEIKSDKEIESFIQRVNEHKNKYQGVYIHPYDIRTCCVKKSSFFFVDKANVIPPEKRKSYDEDLPYSFDGFNKKVGNKKNKVIMVLDAPQYYFDGNPSPLHEAIIKFKELFLERGIIIYYGIDGFEISNKATVVLDDVKNENRHLIDDKYVKNENGRLIFENPFLKEILEIGGYNILSHERITGRYNNECLIVAKPILNNRETSKDVM
ncbi:MAG: hypothetical protein PUP46_04615 [Endozoicomonas sp. (ex Botrylloides leachii)]|nr:hypothetical protein [Endozoicomonas sp. (ex Botrylloides leachii)]